MAASDFRKIGIASAVMMASVFLSRVIGLVREMAVAYVAGAGPEVDAYQIAFILPEILNHLVATGFLSVTFIPIFTRHLVAGSEDEAWRVFSIILCLFGSLALVAVGIGLVFAPQLVALVAPGLEEPAVLAAAVRMTRIILPAQALFYAGTLCMAVQFARERFFIPALAPLIYNLGIIAGGIVLGPFIGIDGFAWGVLAGAFGGNFLVQWLGARQLGLRFRFVWHWRHPDVREYLRLTLPLMLGLTMTFSCEILFRFFGSFLPGGSIAVLNYGLRVMMILVGIFGQAVGTASFPYMARLAAQDRLEDLNRLLNQTLRYLALIIPAAVLLAVLSPELVSLLFERGRFDAEATRLTAEALVWFLPGAVGFAAYTVVVRGFYAIRNTFFPAVFGSVAVLLSLPLYPIGIALMGAEGVALAVSLSAVLQAAALFVIWSRRSGNTGQAAVWRFYLTIGVLGMVMAPILAGFRTWLHAAVDAASLGGSLAVSAGVGCLFAVLILLAGYALKIQEITELAGRVLKFKAQRSNLKGEP